VMELEEAFLSFKAVYERLQDDLDTKANQIALEREALEADRRRFQEDATNKARECLAAATRADLDALETRLAQQLTAHFSQQGHHHPSPAVNGTAPLSTPPNPFAGSSQPKPAVKAAPNGAGGVRVKAAPSSKAHPPPPPPPYHQQIATKAPPNRGNHTGSLPPGLGGHQNSLVSPAPPPTPIQNPSPGPGACPPPLPPPPLGGPEGAPPALGLDPIARHPLVQAPGLPSSSLPGGPPSEGYNTAAAASECYAAAAAAAAAAAGYTTSSAAGYASASPCAAASACTATQSPASAPAAFAPAPESAAASCAGTYAGAAAAPAAAAGDNVWIWD